MDAPVQERAVDPYSENRYSSVINRLSRIVTYGQDIILYPFQSFGLTRVDENIVRVGPGVCVKDDVLIHIKESFDLDFSYNDYYVDDSGDMDAVGYYYIVLQYFYARSLPAPKAWIKIIRDIDGLYKAGTYSDNYIFLGTAHIIYDSVNYVLDTDPNCVSTTDPEDPSIIRPTITNDMYLVDGGVL